MAKTNDLPHAPWSHRLKNGAKAGDPTSAPRCGAVTRRKTHCMAPAMKNGRCRMHGGMSTGPRTLIGQERSRSANFKHGEYSSETRTLIQEMRRLLKSAC